MVTTKSSSFSSQEKGEEAVVVVHCFSTESRVFGEVFVCPITLELRFYQTVFRSPIRFVAERFMETEFSGRLPCAVDRNHRLCKDSLLINYVAQLTWGEGKDPSGCLVSGRSNEGGKATHTEEDASKLGEAIAYANMVAAQLSYILVSLARERREEEEVIAVGAKLY